MKATIAVVFAGCCWMDALAPDYLEQALSRMMHTVCCLDFAKDEIPGIVEQVVTDNRLDLTPRLRHQFEGLVDSMKLPAAQMLFRPGQVPFKEADKPDFEDVLNEAIRVDGNAYRDLFPWLVANPAGMDALEQAYDQVIGLFDRLQARFVPQALVKHTYAPDFAFLTGLQAAGMVLDLETDPWLQSYSFKRVDDHGEIIFTML
jgi:hypothetical protein